MRQARVTVRAPAKINIYLGVSGPRPDGYHDLATVFHALDLADDVVAEPADPGTVSLVVTGEHSAGVPTDESNLAVRAARALARYAGVDAGVRLTLVKRIPVAGGLAGGSADAAATLVACDALWETGCGRAELAMLAARLGSDVPFALHGGTALGSSRGECLAPVMARGRLHWVLAVADEGLSTPAVYAGLDADRSAGEVPEPHVPGVLLTALRNADLPAVGAHMANDLQPVACRLRPGLSRTLATGRDLGALGALVSGSGPTVVLLVPDEHAAEAMADDLVDAGVCSEALVASGPAAGARVLAG